MIVLIIIIEYKIKSYSDKPNDDSYKTNDFERFVNSLTLKQLLVYSKDELYTNILVVLIKISYLNKKLFRLL